MVNGNFEQAYGREVESDKKPKGIWERISEQALSELEKDGSGITSEALERAKSLLKDPKFESEIRKRWNTQTLSENADPDPEKQEKLWIQGLENVIKERISN